MALFDRRKDAQPATPEEPAAPAELVDEPAAAKKVAAAPPAPPEPQAREPESPAPAIHTVAAGESLADLASRYGVPAEEIARQNHVPPPGQIHPGQVLVIIR
jgi:LysM repeat protein